MTPPIWTVQSGHVYGGSKQIPGGQGRGWEVGGRGKDTGFPGGDANVLKLIARLDVPPSAPHAAQHL